MADGPERRPAGGRRGLARRLLWFVLLWAAGVATVAAIAFAVRFWLGP